MRIAHIITRMILGGAQENTLLNCRDLMREHGDDVLLVTGPALGPEGSLMNEVRRVGIPHVQIDSLRRAIHPIHDWRAYREIRTILKEFAPDVVHTHSAKGGILGRLAAHSLSVPAILHTVHGAPFYKHQSALARACYRLCETGVAKRCHAMISVADAMTDLMVDAGVAPRSKFTTVYSGMEVRRFQDRESERATMRGELGYGPDDVVVGKIARLFDLKGHPFVIQAAQEVIAQCPSVRFLFVGDGTLRAQYEQDIARLGLSHHFHFTGLVQPGQIPSLIAAMDVLVHASLREGLARALPQALLLERPVVSFDIHGANEVVLDEETGFLVEACQVSDLAQRIIQLARDPYRREKMGRAGRRLCEKRFDHLHMTQQVRTLYQQVLKARSDLFPPHTIR